MDSYASNFKGLLVTVSLFLLNLVLLISVSVVFYSCRPYNPVVCASGTCALREHP